MKLSIADLKKVLRYDPITGFFFWEICSRPSGFVIKAGDRAGTEKKNPSRRQIIYLGRRYQEHRLAYAFMTGEWPPKGFDVDHIDEDATNNNWSNLRLATRTQNQWNRSNPPKHNKSGNTGVSWCNTRNKWIAKIYKEGSGIHLGYFNSKEGAVAARLAAEQKYCGEFAPNRRL